jgi:hypothetical protein
LIVTYRPEGGAVQTWEYKPAKVRQSRAEMIEKRADMSFDEFGKALLAGRSRARRVLLWHCLSTDHPSYRWEDTPDFAMSEFELAFDVEELATLRAGVAGADVDVDVKDRALAAIDAQIAEAGGVPKGAS